MWDSVTDEFKRRMSYALWAVLMLVLTGCGAPPAPVIEVGAVLVSDDFDTAGAWDTIDSGGVSVGVGGGLMRLDVPAGGYYLTTTPPTYADVLVEVDARVLSDDRSNGVGVACRVQPDGSGYYFLVGNDGSATIRRARGREVTALLAWTLTPAVRTGSERNTVRAACVGQRLMLWVNAQFVGEATDGLYSAGKLGLVGVTTRAGERLTVDFDQLRGFEVTLAPPP
ncbi:MAG: hypothetical protein MUC99_11275 [Anaerolineae bacterium]|jgi:hypothetical protein|nr:hypothetical protein [Anaerolineae bacterium]